MNGIIENFGIAGVMALVIAVAMVIIALHGLVESLTKGPAAMASDGRQDADQMELFGQTQYEAIFLEANKEDGFALQSLAELIERMDVEARLGANGIYSARGSDKTLFFIANGMGDGRLDVKNNKTQRLAFILPLEHVGSPTASFDLMTQAAVTVLRTLGGTLKDGSEQVIGGQAIAHLREKISEWEMARRRGEAVSGA